MAGEIDPLRVVNDAIENGVSVGAIADQLVAFVDRDLAGDDRRSPTVAFFEDFEEVVAGGGIERLKTPIIEDEQLHTAGLSAGRSSSSSSCRRVRPRRRIGCSSLSRLSR